MNTNEIKTNEIQFGVPMKYKDICAMFNDEEKKSTNSKKAQLKEWNKRYLVTKDKTWYTVERELDETEKDIAMNEKEYTTYIENILINMLKHLSDKKNDTHVIFTYRELFEKLGVLNKLYYQVMKPVKPTDIGKENYTYLVSESAKTDFENVYHNINKFFEESQTLLKRMINDALKSMQSRCLIIYSKSYRLYTKVNLPNGKSYIETHECTDKETSEIIDIFNEIMGKYKVLNMNQIHVLPFCERQQFFDDVREKIQAKFNCDNYAPTFDLILGSKAINRAYDDLYTKRRFNHNVQNKLKTSKVMNKSVAPILNDIFIRDLISIL